jgi:hypothetical protein
MRLGTLGLVILMALGVGSATAGRLGAQVSPGPLARAHHDLEGTLKCTKCHGGGKDGMSARCESCHRDIRWLIEQKRGYHASADARATPCASCHPDHAGEDFKMLKWPDGSAERFDHRRAGYALEQKHAEAKCADCHQAKFEVGPAAPLSARKTGQGYTGLETACSSCHEDIHRGALGQRCTTCHNIQKWTVTPGFDHDTTGYALTGKHNAVKCDKCHLAITLAPKNDGAGHLIPVYKPVPHAGCTDCHEDVHQGQFGETCTKCHTTADWKQIDRTRFDHDKTKYPLRGRHASVKCADCHKDFSTPLLKKPLFQACTSCHADAHNRTATLAGRAVDCDKCHNLQGFTTSTYTVDQHKTAKYALDGKHAGVKCADCHRRETSTASLTKWGTSKVVLRPVFQRCLDCHADDHGGQLTSRPGRGECADCHKVQGWTPSTFDRIAHGKLRLALDGRHLDTTCRACHGDDRKGLPALPKVALGKAAFLFKVTELECTACHVDPHKGRFAAAGARPKTKGCLACHDTRAFRPSQADVAAHATYGFVLEGAHRATSCVACHEEMKSAAAAREKRATLVLDHAAFGELAFQAKAECADCHQTPHGDQFSARKDRGRCDACHGVESFAPATRFDHDRDASFATKGAHAKVACAQCHLPDPKQQDPKALIYRPLSGTCESCHGKEGK